MTFVPFVNLVIYSRLFCALAAIFVVKFAVLLQLADHPLLQPGGGLDSDYYYQLAQRAAAGDWLLGPGLYFVSPLYIYFLAVWLAAGAPVFVIKLAQIALGTAACGLVWFTARDWFGERAAWLALLMTALTGVLTFYEVVILQAALDPFLTALDLWLVTRALRKVWLSPIWKVWLSPFFAAGVALAVHSLNRPNVLIWAAGLAVALALRSREGRRSALALAGGIAVALVPVAARNYAAAGTLTPIPSHGGLNLYIGNHPRADGTYRYVEGITPNIAGQAEDARRVAERAQGRQLTDAEVSGHFTRLALNWMRDHPGDAARLFARKVAYTLNGTFLTLNYSYPFYRHESPVLRALFAGPMLLVPLGLMGLFAFRIRGDTPPQGYGLFALLAPLIVISIATFFVASRYRVPLLVLLCVTSGGCVDAILAAIPRRLAALGFAAAGMIAALVLATWNFGLDDLRAEEELQMSLALIDRGRPEEAETYLARAQRDHPDPLRLHLQLGRAYAAAKRYDEAIRHLEVAQARGGRTAESTYELAVAYAETGRTIEALRTLRSIDAAHLREPASAVAIGDLFMRIGLTFARAGRYGEAMDALKEAVRVVPESATAHLNLAVAYAELGRADAAREEARRALALNPSYQRARELLAALGAR